LLSWLLVVGLDKTSMAQADMSSVRGTFYVDCDSQATEANGRSIESPWKTLADVNSHTFAAGDTISFKRGSACEGMLLPKGSGSAEHPIHLTAYGSGVRPKILASRKDRQAFLLDGQEYWDVDSLDISGGNTYGVFVTGEKGVLHHIHLANLVVHDVNGGELKSKDNGLVVISPSSVDERFDDVLVDGVTAYNTTQWVGILVGGGNFGYPPESTWSNHAVIRNSVVHDVQGDGIVLFRIRNGLIASSVAWNTGMQDTEKIGTPNAIWTWMCHDCVVTQNEAFLTDSPGVDGGAFDIDYGNTNNSVIENYGHDTQGYCIAVFGAGFVTRQSVVRGNLCINNGRSPRMADYQGAIFLLSWNNGSIDGLTVENNTVFWNAYEAAPALINEATIKAGTAVFRGNTVYSTSPWMVNSNRDLTATHNTYNYFGTGSPHWQYGAQHFNNVQSMENEAGEERGSQLALHAVKDWKSAPAHLAAAMLPKFSASKGFGNEWKSLQGEPYRFAANNGQWHLYAVLPVSLNADGLPEDDALQQIVALRSVAEQYAASGLKLTLLLSLQNGSLQNMIGDLDLQDIEIESTRNSSDKPTEQTILVTPDGHIAEKWDKFAGPTALGLPVRQWLGEPIYSQIGIR
jgi:hypothetical protein